MKKVYIIIIVVVIMIALLILTNPNLEDFNEYRAEEEERLGITPPETPKIIIEHINFYIFSTYTPFVEVIDENGVTHLGIMGKFYKVSDGQFDYPWWLEPFN
ncbi:hypothetical protein [Chengkuizengella marina]|uniref:Uncharacterized protein n=1 Tax=Chengkuizengella marina TaxID=2507566 RepID=A0A6N9Q4F8_9BACL|nr:hypothetical protein [Chengkuizengella marina]NBI29651.1 hypothetical protein [Chengkuizengella marina]